MSGTHGLAWLGGRRAMPIDTDYCTHLPRFINDTLHMPVLTPSWSAPVLANLATRKKQYHSHCNRNHDVITAIMTCQFCIQTLNEEPFSLLPNSRQYFGQGSRGTRQSVTDFAVIEQSAGKVQNLHERYVKYYL